MHEPAEGSDAVSVQRDWAFEKYMDKDIMKRSTSPRELGCFAEHQKRVDVQENVEVEIRQQHRGGGQSCAEMVVNSNEPWLPSASYTAKCQTRCTQAEPPGRDGLESLTEIRLEPAVC